jgi:hypothetical protein
MPEVIREPVIVIPAEQAIEAVEDDVNAAPMVGFDPLADIFAQQEFFIAQIQLRIQDSIFYRLK